MVEVASSNLAGPTNSLTTYFYETFIFRFTKYLPAVASCLYRRKVVLKDGSSQVKQGLRMRPNSTYGAFSMNVAANVICANAIEANLAEINLKAEPVNDPASIIEFP